MLGNYIQFYYVNICLFPNKPNDITEILLKVALNTITQEAHLRFYMYATTICPLHISNSGIIELACFKV